MIEGLVNFFAVRGRVPAVALVFCLGGLLPVRAGSAPAASRPNIILIVADDMGFSDLGCYGGEIATPNLDQLAREGLRFTQFYNNAKCTTSRASLLSGMYPRGKGGSIPREIPTVAENLRAAGYQTGMSGKWHLGSTAPQRPVDRGFDEYFGVMDGAVNYFNPAQRDPEFKGHKLRPFAHNSTLITEFPADFYTTDAFATHAIRTIERFAHDGRPFFLHLAFNAPHFPLQAWPADIAKYRGKYRGGWDQVRQERYARQIKLGLIDPRWSLPPADSQSYDWAKANQDWEDLRMATYAAMVDRMDQNLGRLFRALKELGIEDNTVVMFLSDNGASPEEPGGRDESQQPGLVSTYTAVGPAWSGAQNTPWRRYKSWTNEGGISTPLIVRWPKQVKAGTSTNQLGHIIDLASTCLELAGAQPLSEINGNKTLPMEGKSLVPIFHGGQRTPPDELFWEWDDNYAVRAGKWKLVWDSLNPQKQWQLYDLEADRTEITNLASAHPALVEKLKADFERWAKTYSRPSASRLPSPPSG